MKDYNLQSWVSLRDVATIIRHIEEKEKRRVSSISEIIREMIAEKVREIEKEGLFFSSTSEALSYLEERRFKVGSIKKSCGKKYLKTLQEEAKEPLHQEISISKEEVIKIQEDMKDILSQKP